jgi:cobalt-zinc-cadmium efflux system outer membrane protein
MERDLRVSQGAEDEFRSAEFRLESLDSLSVEDAIRLAIQHNPQLRAAGYRVDAASGRVLQAGLYPNPSLSFSGESIGADGGSGGETAYTIEQEIVLGGRIQRARDVADSDKQAAQESFVAQEFTLATQVSRAYFGVVAAQQELSDRRELSELSSQLLDAVRARVEAGSATEPDLLRAEVVYEQSRIVLESARNQDRAARQTLASVIGVEQRIDLPLTTSVDEFVELPAYEDIVASTLRANSRMALARISVQRARQAHRLAQAESAPTLVASVGPRYSDIDGETTLDVGLNLEIPLFDRNQGEIEATLSERLSASAELRNVQLELLAEVAQAWSVYQSSLVAVDQYQQQLLPKAERTLDLTRQAYQSGKADYLRLLDAQQVLIESRLSYVEAAERLHRAAALLNELSQTHAHWREPRDEDQALSEMNQ